ncbi:SusC/RagA family TonB-linked outer membrane protein [Flagellimonas olearia]|nr:SusC/RagA family TonB-linked outer membrane protein [Allomuricauda olearia]
MIVAFFQIYASDTYAQKTKITLSLDKVPVEDVLNEIERQTDFKFFYNDNDLDYRKMVSINANKQKVFSILNHLFKDTRITYEVYEKQIILKIDKSLLPLRSEAIPPPVQFTVTGKVVDGNDSPLPGANILEKGTTNGTVSDFDGNFSLDVKEGSAVLVFSYLGFQSKEVSVDEQSSLSVKLIEDTAGLDEVVLVGYGSQKKSSVTASVVSVDADEANKNITHDAALSLQGRAPGVEILTQGGISGAEAKVIIRGVGTFGETAPLFVIDGAFSTSGLRGLNPADIESIEVLKDGSAAAIYGSRAANGVVLITTKKGKKGQARFEFSSSISMQTLSKKLDYANADQWRRFANQVSDNDGIARAPENDNPNLSNGVDVDWQDTWFRSAAPIYNNTMSVSGGTEHTTYNASLGYFKQEGILKFSEFEKYNARINVGFKKGRVEFTENLGFSYYRNDPNTHFNTGGTSGSGYELPTVPVRNSDGEFVAAGNDFQLLGIDPISRFALASMDQRVVDNFDVIGSTSLSYELVKGLKYRIGLSGSYNSEHNFDRESAYNIPVIGDNSVTGISVTTPSINESRSISFDYTIDNLLTYDQTFGKHDFSLLGGYSRFRENLRTTGYTVIFENAFDDQFTTFDGEAQVTGDEFKSLLVSWFGRLNYAFDDRYLLSLSIRRDKSSKFAEGFNIGTFPSISAGWNVSNEAFFPKDGFISKLKIRGGYGELGANFIKPYQFVSIAKGPIPVLFGDVQNSSADRTFGRVIQLFTENLTWESAQSTNVGMELGLLNNALSLTAEYFRKVNKDVLAPVSLPASVGQTIEINTARAPNINSSEIENKGLEFLLDYQNRNNEFKYNVSFNLSTIKNEVLALGENVTPIVGALVSSRFDDRPGLTDTGGPVGALYGYRTQGLDGNGNFIFEDVNGRDVNGELTGQPDGQIDFDDRVQIGDPFPDFTYGLNFAGEYKKFDFSLFFQGSQGNDIFSQIKYSNYFVYTGNVVTDALNAWTPANTNTNIPRATLDNRSGGNSLPSDFYIEDGSYLRLKNIQIGYSLPENILEGLNINSARLFIGAQNLFTITGYSGYDPEVSSDAQFNRGIDFRGYPNTRTLTLGFNASF